MTFAETVNKVIELAAARLEYIQGELPEHHPEYPLANEHEDDPWPPPAEEAELRVLLGGLPVEDLYRIGSLMYYGRKYAAKGDLGVMYRRFVQDFPEPDWVAEWMSQYSPLADSLRDALDLLYTVGLDVDAMRAIPA